MTSGSINVNERGGGGQQRSYFMWIFKLYENGVYKSYLNRQTCDKNTLTHPHSKYTQVQHSTKTTMKTTTYKVLCSGSHRHMRYIGQLSRLHRSQRQRHIGSNSMFRLLVEDSQHKKLRQSVGLVVRHTLVKKGKRSFMKM